MMGSSTNHGAIGILEAIRATDAHVDVGPCAVVLKRAIGRRQYERVASGQAFDAKNDTAYRESGGPRRLDNDALSFRRQSNRWELDRSSTGKNPASDIVLHPAAKLSSG